MQEEWPGVGSFVQRGGDGVRRGGFHLTHNNVVTAGVGDQGSPGIYLCEGAIFFVSWEARDLRT